MTWDVQNIVEDDGDDIPVLPRPTGSTGGGSAPSSVPPAPPLPGWADPGDDDDVVGGGAWTGMADVMRTAQAGVVEDDDHADALDIDVVDIADGSGGWGGADRLPPEYLDHVKKIKKQKAKQERAEKKLAAKHEKDEERYNAEVNQLLERLKDGQRELARVRRQEAELQKKTKDMEEKHKKELQKMQGRHEALIRKAQEARQKRKIHEGQNEFDVAANAAGALNFDDIKTGDVSCFEVVKRVWAALGAVVARHAPYARDVVYIESQFGESIAEYFEFHRWIILTSICLSLIGVCVFCIAHLVVLSATDDLDGTHEEQNHSYPAPGIYPFDWLFYSSYTNDERLYFSLCVVLLSLLTFGAFTAKVVNVAREASFKAYEEEFLTKTRYSRTTLSLVDFTAQTQEDMENLRYSASAALLTLLDGDNMTRRDRITGRLLAVRIATNCAHVAITVATWMLVIVIKTNEDGIVSTVVGDKDAKASDGVFTQLIPALLTSIVTMVPPPIAILLTLWEEWESPERVLVLQVVRIYVTQVVIILLFIYQGYVTLTEGSEDSCPPDEFGVSLFVLAATKLLSVIVADLGFILVGKYLTIYAFKEEYERPEFSTAYNLMQLLYVQALIWLALPHLPIAIVPGTLLLMLQFKFYVYLVKTHLRRPSLMWSPTDTSSWFLSFFFITFFLTQAANVYLWTFFDRHLCGPFPRDSEPMFTWLDGEIVDVPVLSFVYIVVKSPYTLVLLAMAFLTLASKRSSQREALSEYLVYYQEQLKADEEVHNRQVTALRAQLEALKSTVRDLQAE